MLLSMLTRYCFRLFTLHEEPLRLGLLHPFGVRKQAHHLLPKRTQPGGGWVLVLLDSMVQAIGTSGLALGSRSAFPPGLMASLPNEGGPFWTQTVGLPMPLCPPY